MSVFTRKLKKHYNRFKMFLDQHSSFSYSQEGEDKILMRYFEFKQYGFYIDIGAHHPKRFSNTYLFYQKGWNGLNVDAMPGSMIPFKKARSRDINIEAAISDKASTLDFFLFNDPALNTLSEELAKSRIDPAKNHFLVGTQTVHTTTLTSLLDKHLQPFQKIDFMSIDIEGFDYFALKSLDFNRYRPELILVEIYSEDLAKDEVYNLLIVNGYTLSSKSVLTCIFKDSKTS